MDAHHIPVVRNAAGHTYLDSEASLILCLRKDAAQEKSGDKSSFAFPLSEWECPGLPWVLGIPTIVASIEMVSWWPCHLQFVYIKLVLYFSPPWETQRNLLNAV